MRVEWCSSYEEHCISGQRACARDWTDAGTAVCEAQNQSEHQVIGHMVAADLQELFNQNQSNSNEGICLVILVHDNTEKTRK